MQAKALKRGADRMAELGRKRLTVWFDQREWQQLTAACEATRSPLARFVRRGAMHLVSTMNIPTGKPAGKPTSKAKRKEKRRAT